MLLPAPFPIALFFLLAAAPPALAKPPVPGITAYVDASGDLRVELHDDVAKGAFNAGVLWAAMNAGPEEPDEKVLSVPDLEIRCHTIQTPSGRIGDCSVRVAKEKFWRSGRDCVAIYRGKVAEDLVFSRFKVPGEAPVYADESIGDMGGGALLITMNYGLESRERVHFIINVDESLMQ